MTGLPAVDTAPKPTDDEINWAIAAHMLSFVGAWLALGVIGPLCIYLAKGERSSFVRSHAVEGVNFNINVLAAIAICGVLTLVLIGYLLLALVGLAYAYFVVRGALVARQGKLYRYPCVFRLMK